MVHTPPSPPTARGGGRASGGGVPMTPRRSVASDAMDLGVEGKVALVTAASERPRSRLGAGARRGGRAGRDQLPRPRAPPRHRGGARAPTSSPSPATSPTPRRLGDWSRRPWSGSAALHILVANAGGPPKGRAIDVDDATLQAAIDANLLTSVRLVREALPAPARGRLGPDLPDRVELGEAAHPRPRHVEHRPRRSLGMGEDRRPGARRRGDHAQPRLPRPPPDAARSSTRASPAGSATRRTSGAWLRSSARNTPVSSRAQRCR